MSDNKNNQSLDQEKAKAAAKPAELSPEEMDAAVGGINMDQAIKQLVSRGAVRQTPCTNPEGHHWVYTHHVEEENRVFGFIPCGTMGYNYFKCSHCQAVKKEHV